MGRLTVRNKNGDVGLINDKQSVTSIEVVENVEAALDKLAHYEDLEEQGRLIEQKKGKWIPNKRMVRTPTAENYHCSECTQTGKTTAYCPNCGAKMELKELEGAKE